MSSSRISRLLLWRSLVHFRGQPFGTTAAASHTNSSDGSKQALPSKSPRFACLHSHSRGLSGFYGCSRRQNEIEVQAWINLRHSLVNVHGQPVGTIPAFDNSGDKPNHDRVFVRDFVPSALAFLLNGEPLIVKNFIKKTLDLHSWGTTSVDHFRLEKNTNRNKNVDSGFWWIFLLRAYTVSTGDTSLVDSPECQKGIKLILNECLSDPFPTLLCADGCCMMDRRMGINGYPIEIQALFFMALKCATILIRPDGDGNEILERILKRIDALSFHMRSYFWMDPKELNDMYRYKSEEYSHTAANKFNIAPDSFPEWILDFLPPDGGYFLGNVGPWKMDFRWFCIGNCVAILSSLATQKQASAIMKLIDSRWNELVGEMPLKICYPAMENHEWRIVTGCDPKNTSWSNHNGGSWPVLLWLLTAASMKARRCDIGTRAIELAEKRLFIDNWPEYYDGKLGRFIGKHARKHQTQSVAGYLVAKMMLQSPSQLGVFAIQEHKQMKPVLKLTS